MHLAIVSPFPPTITGIGQYGYHVTRALIASKNFSRITVLAGSNAGNTAPISLNSAEINYCWRPDQISTWQTILSHVKRLRPDIVWFNLGASAFGRLPLVNLLGMFTPMTIKQMGIPTVVTLHEVVPLADLRALNAPGGVLAPLGAHLLTHIASQADVVCLTMKHYADWLSARGVNCMHLPIGAYYQPEMLPENNGQDILFFTTLAPYKGLEILLAAYESLKPEFPKMRLMIAGANHTRFPEYAKDLKTKFNDTFDIHWLGQISEERVIELFRQTNVVILPYTASTGSSSVLTQAATWGRAIIASDLIEHQNIAAESDLHIEFFKNGDEESLRAALRKMLRSGATRSAQADHNFNSIQRSLPSLTSQQYIQAFNHALELHNTKKRIKSTFNETDPA